MDKDNDKELDGWAELARLARTSWTKDNPWEEDETGNSLNGINGQHKDNKD